MVFVLLFILFSGYAVAEVPSHSTYAVNQNGKLAAETCDEAMQAFRAQFIDIVDSAVENYTFNLWCNDNDPSDKKYQFAFVVEPRSEAAAAPFAQYRTDLETQKFLGHDIQFKLVDNIETKVVLEVGPWDDARGAMDVQYAKEKLIRFPTYTAYEDFAKATATQFWSEISNRPFLEFVRGIVGEEEFPKVQKEVLTKYNFAAAHIVNAVVLASGERPKSAAANMYIYRDCAKHSTSCALN